jgi:hypothetical protein
LPEHWVIGTCRHAPVQVAALPVSCSAVQGSPSSAQVVGQVPGGSQVSPAPMSLSPHCGLQSPSLPAVQPIGQQPSPDRQPVTGWWMQVRVQPSGDPEAKSSVQASASSQVRGQAPGKPAVIARSQLSLLLTTPSPQIAAQSESEAIVQPAGQQPSPPAHPVIGIATQWALQVSTRP